MTVCKLEQENVLCLILSKLQLAAVFVNIYLTKNEQPYHDWDTLISGEKQDGRNKTKNSKKKKKHPTMIPESREVERGVPVGRKRHSGCLKTCPDL